MEKEYKEFWERCGFKFEKGGWRYPTKDKNLYSLSLLPRPTLDNLFKYAVPKLKQANGYYYVGLKYELAFGGKWVCQIESKKVDKLSGRIGARGEDSKDPAQALYQAIRKVIKDA